MDEAELEILENWSIVLTQKTWTLDKEGCRHFVLLWGIDGLLKSVYIVTGMIQLAKGVAAGAQQTFQK